MITQDLSKRINFDGDLSEVFRILCEDLNLGNYISYREIPVGYEDFNVMVQVSDKKYFIKVFASERSALDVTRYVDVLANILENGVSHPKLYQSEGGVLYEQRLSGLKMVAMDFIDGKTFLELDRVPNQPELQKIMKQAVLINNTQYKPPFIHDTWAIANIQTSFDDVKAYLDKEDIELVKQVIGELGKVSNEDLPHCLVHGDLIKSNVILAEDDSIFVLDFSVANWYPRVNELAIIIGSLMNDFDNKITMAERIELVAKMYVENGGALTHVELQALPSYVRASYAMEFLGACRMKFLKNNQSSENKYWLELGRKSMQRVL